MKNMIRFENWVWQFPDCIREAMQLLKNTRLLEDFKTYVEMSEFILLIQDMIDNWKKDEAICIIADELKERDLVSNNEK